ncbi:MAG TPA: hypothetical protein VK837_01485 [Longimicrobiales bacterium]|nr:hypothetical protein [Longimicrobiales bacterium]
MVRSMAGAILIGSVAMAAACDDGVSPTNQELPDTVSTSQLQFMPLPAGVAAQLPAELRLWAVRGEDRRLELDVSVDGGEPEDFLRFEVDAESLLRRPDGSAFADGDSIEVVLRFDERFFLFDFEPSGLTFDPDRPARLDIDYGSTRGDLDGSGTADEADAEFEGRLDLWRQERPGDPWIRAGTLKLEDLDEMRAEITGFTGFVLAG